jgi:SAM-dependent methyltransferase
MNKTPDNQTNPPLNLKDYFLTNEEFQLIENKKFGYLETFPVPENLSKYYESENYISHTDTQKTVFEWIYQFIKKQNLRYKFSLLNHPKPDKNLLDIGCGAGDFLKFAKDRNLNIFGIEPNQKARKIAGLKLGNDTTIDSEISGFKQEFDYITLWHVLEHIPNLHETIWEIKAGLKPDGKLYIAVPNYRSFDAKFYKNYWAGYDAPRHLWHFSPESLEKLFTSFGMKIEKKYPLLFDSYYVSWLSEKYKNSKLGFFKSLTIGTISNCVGFFNGNYSSIIYQISKN